MNQQKTDNMKENYTITQEHFDKISDLKNALEIYSDVIQSICDNDRDDAKWIGFELGKLHNDMRRDFISTMDLLYTINSQNS